MYYGSTKDLSVIQMDGEHKAYIYLHLVNANTSW